MNASQCSLALLGLLLSQSSLFGQYLGLDKTIDGLHIHASYQGNANWLAEQKDPKSHLHKIPNLDVLTLVQHDISEAEMRYVATLESVDFLTIGSAPEAVNIDASALAYLGKCQSLESVWMCKTKLQDSDLEPLLKLKRLEYITIERETVTPDDGRPLPPVLTDQAIHTLSRIKSLRSISIRFEELFTDACLDDLATLPKLESLELGSARFTDKTIEAIAKKLHLKEADISSTNITPAGHKMLAEYLGKPNPPPLPNAAKDQPPKPDGR